MNYTILIPMQDKHCKHCVTIASNTVRSNAATTKMILQVITSS